MSPTQVVLKANGLYYVEGKGFTASSVSDATRLNPQEAECAIGCARKFGYPSATTEAVANVSFAPVYIRKDDSVSLTGVTKGPPGQYQVDPSPRRFATFGEAAIHAGRFYVRRAHRGDQQGSAGHIGAYVVETNDPVNSRVNPETGLTNPIAGWVYPRK